MHHFDPGLITFYSTKHVKIQTPLNSKISYSRDLLMWMFQKLLVPWKKHSNATDRSQETHITERSFNFLEINVKKPESFLWLKNCAQKIKSLFTADKHFLSTFKYIQFNIRNQNYFSNQSTVWCSSLLEHSSHKWIMSHDVLILIPIRFSIPPLISFLFPLPREALALTIYSYIFDVDSRLEK